MKLTALERVAGAYLVEHDRHPDQRGFFEEIYSSARYGPIARDWPQINVSRSVRHAVRGLHRSPYDKLGTCVAGRIFDVVVDLRPESPTYRAWEGVWLDEDNRLQLFVPARCGHGLYGAADASTFVYAQWGLFHPHNEVEVSFRDPDLAIAWPAVPDEAYVLSDKDRAAPRLRDVPPERLAPPAS